MRRWTSREGRRSGRRTSCRSTSPTGSAILARVKSDEHLKRTPVVVLTTTDDKLEIERCYDLGANVYITKPMNYESFADAIRQLGLFLSVIQVPDVEI